MIGFKTTCCETEVSDPALSASEPGAGCAAVATRGRTGGWAADAWTIKAIRLTHIVQEIVEFTTRNLPDFIVVRMALG
jgi:hypothetical protein